MDQFKYVLNRESIYRTIFIKIFAVTEYGDLQTFQRSDREKYDIWSEMAGKRYGDVTNKVYLSKACYMPELSKIIGITIGNVVDNDGKMERKIHHFFGEEKDIISNFFQMFDLNESGTNPFLCGHNIVGYDIPFLIKRGLYHDLSIPTIIKDSLTSKPWDNEVIDTVNLWKFNGGDYMPLNLIASFLNLKYKTIPMPLDEMNIKYWSDPSSSSTLKWAEYENANQVNLTIQLYRKLHNM